MSEQDIERRRQAMSELMDGAGDAMAIQRACASWREDADARADWHAYHLIGDVLRSDDLAHAPRHDEGFLAALRLKLADEPVVLAPVARRAEPARRRGWMAPAAVAAGFVAVAGVLVVTRVGAPPDALGGGGSMLVSAQPPRADAIAVQPVVQTLVGREMVRDPWLDRYLAAHKEYGNSSALAVPGVVLRSATTAAPQR